MSTRRARIKAVTSLPPRRKNADAADSRSKEVKTIVEKVAKSPKTSQALGEYSDKSKEVQTNVEKITKSPGTSQTLEEVKTNIEKFSKTPKTSQVLEGYSDTSTDVKAGFEKVTKSSRTSAASERRYSDIIKNIISESQVLNSKSKSTPTGVTVIIEHLQDDKSAKEICVEQDVAPTPSSSSQRMDSSIFASPLCRKGSPRTMFASPLAPSPKTIKGIDTQKSTPKSRPTPLPQNINENNELQIMDTVINKVTHDTSTKKKQLRQDYVRTISESTNDEEMDGIVPLIAAVSVPKPIDVLKSEIISENAEVLFDPIVPLPSPSKVRPKLRPTPRLGPRRNSIQGSASESEDESRRNLAEKSTPSRQRHDSHVSIPTLPNRDVARVRNDSVCSSVSQAATQAAPPTSPVKEKLTTKARRQEMSNRRLMAMKRKRENVTRDNLTMYDLIYYNPFSNPIVPNQDEENAKEANNKNIGQKDSIIEDDPDDPPSADAAPVPQIKLGPNGEIMLDETSLVIKQTNSGRTMSSAIHERTWTNGGSKYTRSSRSADWPPAETVRFYRALAAVGTDFTLMAPLFPDRTRKELKFKFKKEEKRNCAQVDKALRTSVGWDVMGLKEEFKKERELAAQKADEERKKLLADKKAERERVKAARENRVRPSKGAKALESSMLPGLTSSVHTEIVTAEDLIERKKKLRKKKKQKSPPPQNTVRTPQMAKITSQNKLNTPESDMAVITKVTTPSLQVKTPDAINLVPQLPNNIEMGSLVVLTVNDPASPTKKMLQTYIAHGEGKLTPVALPSTLLNSVVGYMKKNTPKSASGNSPQLMSPSSVTSHDSRTSSTPSGISVLSSPAKRQRHSSYTITQL